MTRNSSTTTSYLRQIGRAFGKGQAGQAQASLLRPVHTFVRRQEVLPSGINVVMGPSSDDMTQTDLSPAYTAMQVSSPPSTKVSASPSDKQHVALIGTEQPQGLSLQEDSAHVEATSRNMPPIRLHTGANPAPTVKRDRPLSALQPTMSSTDEHRDASPIHPVGTQHPISAQMPQTKIDQEPAPILFNEEEPRRDSSLPLSAEPYTHRDPGRHTESDLPLSLRGSSSLNSIGVETISPPPDSPRTTRLELQAQERVPLAMSRAEKRPLDQPAVKLDAPRRVRQQRPGGMSVEAISSPPASPPTTRLEPQAQERAPLVTSKAETQTKTLLQIGTIDVHILPAPVTPPAPVPPRPVPGSVQTRPTALPALAREMTSTVGLRQS